MESLYDFGIEIQKIREAINSLTVKGGENASYLVYAINKCNDIIKAINTVAEQQQNHPESQNGEEGEDVDGEQNRDITPCD